MDIRKYMSPSVVGEDSGSDESNKPPPSKIPKIENTKPPSEAGDNILQSLSKDEIEQFLDLMKEKIHPKHENLSYRSGFLKMDWQSIQFKNFTVDECQKLWTEIQNQQRRYRTLTDLISDAKIWNRNPPKKKGLKKMKIEGLPKKPLSSYLLYFQKEYQKMKASNPKTNCIVASKIIGEKFKTLSPHKKSRLQEESQTSKEDYISKLALFKEEHPDLVDKKTEKHKSEKSKKPDNGLTRTPFKIYYDEKCQENQNLDHMKAKEKFNKLSNLEKAHYIHLAKVEFMDIVSTNSNNFQVKPSVTKEEERLYLSTLGVPEKPPSSGYVLFCHDYNNSEEMKQSKNPEKFKQASEQWHKLTEEEKRNYALLQKEKSLQYQKDFAAFLNKLKPEEQNHFLMYKILPMDRPLTNKDASETEADPDPMSMVNTEIETSAQKEFPNSAREFYRQKTGQKWKALDQEEKEKWTKKFEKKKRRHEKAHQNNTSAVESE